MEKLDAAESRGSTPGILGTQELLGIFNQQPGKKVADGSHEKRKVKKGGDESWRQGLFSYHKKLQTHWEQVSPTVKETLSRYSPRKLRGLFNAENVSDMEEAKHKSYVVASEILEERQHRYKQIAEFCLSEEPSSLKQSYLSQVGNASASPNVYDKKHTEIQVPYLNTTSLSQSSSVDSLNIQDSFSRGECNERASDLSSDFNIFEPRNFCEDQTPKPALSAFAHLKCRNNYETYLQKGGEKVIEVKINEGPKDKETSAEITPALTETNNSISDCEDLEEIPQLCGALSGAAEGTSKKRSLQAESSCSDQVNDLPCAMPVGTPHIKLPAAKVPEASHRPNSLHPPPQDPHCQMKRKSPVTVQEWVDHLPVEAAQTNVRAEELAENTGRLRCHADSRLSREASVQSSSSLDSLLESRRPDPVEVLLNLGFGGLPGIDLDNCRIPKRFLVPSKCKGGDWNEFLRRELLQVQNFECTSLGFRGLSGPSHQRPSAIVANIMEKLRERSAPPPQSRSRFTSVALRVLSETSVVSRLSLPRQYTPSASVLTPDNRKFLENQGNVSPEASRRRITFGTKSFAIGKDGELVEEETLPKKDSEVSVISEMSMSSWSAGSAMSGASAESDTEEIPSPAQLLRMRRSSLQRQRNVEEEQEDGPAIPRRFLPVPEGNDDLRDVLAAEMQTLSRKIRSAQPEELAAILEPIKELKVKLNEL